MNRMDYSMYPLELSDEFGMEGVPNRERMLQWLDSWLKDADSDCCVIRKLSDFDPQDYVS